MALHLSQPASCVAVTVLLVLYLAVLTSGQCSDGKFGPDCRHSCHCLNESACDVKTGACEEGCQGHYSGPSCQRRNVALGARIRMTRPVFGCSSYFTDGNHLTCCDSRNFRTDSGPMFTITLNSTYKLSHIAVSLRDPLFASSDQAIEATSEKGMCTTMSTNTANITISCDFPGRNLYINISSRYGDFFALCEVEVFVCSKGFYGENCSQMCDHCKNDDCDQKTGACSDGCEAGYTGSQCDKTCVHGTFGQNCNKVCGRCQYGNSCNVKDGACSDGCEAGYTGSQCNKTCARETYGHGCSLSCPQCHTGMSCHHVTGSCPQMADRLGAGIGVGIAVCLILGTLVLVGAWLARKRGYGFLGRPHPASESTSAPPAQDESYVALDPSTREAPNLYEDVQGTYENTTFTEGRAKAS